MEKNKILELKAAYDSVVALMEYYHTQNQINPSNYQHTELMKRLFNAKVRILTQMENEILEVWG